MSEERNAPGGSNPPSEEQEPYDEDYLEEEPQGDGGQPPEPDETEQEEEPGEAEPRQQTQPRRSHPGRSQRLSAENRELKERLDRYERELQGFRTQQAAPPRIDPLEQQRLAQQEREYVATLLPEQQTLYWREKDRREFSAALQQIQQSTAQQIDKSTWDAACRADPRRAAFAARVEDMFQTEARAGRPQAREVIYHYLLGQEVDRQAGRRTNQQRQAAARRLQQQRTRPGGARSDGPPPARRPADDSYEAALERTRGQALW